MIKLSICIPTYNRSQHLSNCLHSVISMRKPKGFKFEICISDNGSNDNTKEVVNNAKKKIKINYNRNESNIGIARNFLKVVSMAKGEFTWLIGDDDLLLPNTLVTLEVLFKNHNNVNFFYINSYLLHTDYVFSFPQPFDISKLPSDMNKFSSYKKSQELNFFELINPKVSFDFLGGMFLSIFKRSMWLDNISVLNNEAIEDPRLFSHFDNTFPHVKIFSAAFSNSKAYFHADPLTVCLSGAREWKKMNPLVSSVRLVEALDEYRKNGLNYFQYINCKNFALSNIIPHLLKMFLHKEESGYTYINTKKHVLNNMLYPNFYLSAIYYLKNKIKAIIKS
ncbi:glycosyltransferase family 2 protein [Flavobacteriaceae bacterium]|nr:glycosyltransferase family 2 protein [Flavobacteriaceae bacterium]